MENLRTNSVEETEAIIENAAVSGEANEAITEVKELNCEAVEVSEEIISSEGEPVEVTEEIISSENEVIEETEEIVSSENEVIEETEEIVSSENEANEAVEEVSSTNYATLTKAQIVVQLENRLKDSNPSKKEVDALRQAFYKLLKSETDEKKKVFVEAGGNPEEFAVEQDSLELLFKELLNTYRERRTQVIAEMEKAKEEILAARLAIIEQLKELTNNPEDISKIFIEFNRLQQEWNTLKQRSNQITNEVWRNYQLYVERFFDFVRINNEFRDYDFKKNLDTKLALCESVEKMVQEQDVLIAFRQMQKLQQEWRDSGPVAKERREEIWQRFRTACTEINKRHQDHFDDLRSTESAHQEAKEALIAQVSGIEYDKLDSNHDWEEKTKEVIAIQEQWKSTGFAPKKVNNILFDKFRALCDEFFIRKGERYKKLKDDLIRNLDAKTILCEKAESLRDNTEWRETSEVFIQMQKEWRTIGSIPRRYSDHIWKRFSSACDYFFEQRNSANSAQRGEEQENLTKKREIIEIVQSFTGTIGKLRQLISDFNALGHVPMRDKDKIYKEFREAVDAQFNRLNVDESNRRLHSFRNTVSDMAEKGVNKLRFEKDRLVRNLELMKTELQTNENNIGFFSVSSKNKNKGNIFLKELEQKIEKLKEEIALTVKKIELIDKSGESKD